MKAMRKDCFQEETVSRIEGCCTSGEIRSKKLSFGFGIMEVTGDLKKSSFS